MKNLITTVLKSYYFYLFVSFILYKLVGFEIVVLALVAYIVWFLYTKQWKNIFLLLRFLYFSSHLLFKQQTRGAGVVPIMAACVVVGVVMEVLYLQSAPRIIRSAAVTPEQQQVTSRHYKPQLQQWPYPPLPECNIHHDQQQHLHRPRPQQWPRNQRKHQHQSQQKKRFSLQNRNRNQKVSGHDCYNSFT